MHLESGAVGADPACAVFDADEDGDLDLSDVASAMNAFTGDCALGITTPPHGSGPCIGDFVTLSVDVRGQVASRQWRKEDADIPGATDGTHTIGPITASSEGYYGVRLTSACGWETTSDRRYWLKVRLQTPVISSQPETQTTCAGNDVRFCTFLSSIYDNVYDYVAFEWQKKVMDSPGGEWIPIDGADWWCMFLRDVDESDAGQYRCVVTNGCGETTSQPATLSLGPPAAAPTITAQPVPVSLQQTGQLAILGVSASCAETYQWRWEGIDLDGETLDQLTIPEATCQDAGTYTVVVTNSAGSTQSEPAAITVGGCP